MQSLCWITSLTRLKCFFIEQFNLKFKVENNQLNFDTFYESNLLTSYKDDPFLIPTIKIGRYLDFHTTRGRINCECQQAKIRTFLFWLMSISMLLRMSKYLCERKIQRWTANV